MNENIINPHGGDIYIASKEYGYKIEDIMDYSANINPLGVPQGLKEKIIASIDQLVNYPDPDCTVLKEAISQYLKISEENIIVGNGASEIIFLLFEVLAPKKVMIPAPSFSEYAQAAARNGAEVSYFRLKEEQDFKLDIQELMQQMTEEVDAIILCNPNNPTSTLVSREDLLNLLEHASKKNIQLIVDEAFIELTDGANANSMIEYMKENDNLFVVRAFTKLFAIPGLRLGYGVGNVKTIKRLWEKKLPWSVNGLACCVGEYLGESSNYLEKTKTWITQEKLWFYKELQELEGMKVYKPETNFILLKLLDKGMNSWKLKEQLAQKGLLIRDASNFVFLNDRFIRVAIKDRQSNIKFLRTFTEIWGGTLDDDDVS